MLGTVLAAVLFGTLAAAQSFTIKDDLTLPITGSPEAKAANPYLARINMMVEEPGRTGRFFLVDMTGPLYILDSKTNRLIKYLDLNQIFHRLRPDLFSQGFVAVQFDPDYVHNGKFYTTHAENPANPASAQPDNSQFPGLNLTGYTTTPAIPTAGRIPALREDVLVEWTDTNISDTTFQGTAREIVRVQMNRPSHPLDDMIFNPAAHPGDPDWRVMYVSCGDGASGEAPDPTTRLNPQRLDRMLGKIWRIIPDPALHTATSTISENGRYRIPNDNPFFNTPGARKEIWAYGLRNPHRLTWDVDPRGAGHLIAEVIGLHTWETAIIVHKGANYGYSLREGHQQLNGDNSLNAIPAPDEIPIRISDTKTIGAVAPHYPVIEYPHQPGGGDAISSGFVYRGKKFPALDGKYIFGDITTGHIWWCDFAEMLAIDANDPHHTAKMHEISIREGEELFPTMYPITLAKYHARGGQNRDLPGYATVSGGRADIHLITDSAGEIYILSKSDGMIRQVTSVQ